MIEVVAVGAAAVVAAKLARFFRGKEPEHPLTPDAYWNDTDVPGGVLKRPSVYSRRLTWPHEGAPFYDKVAFEYFVPPGWQRGIVYRAGGGGLIEGTRESLRILREVQRMIVQLYGQETLEAIAKRKAWIEEAPIRDKANAELAAIEKAWLAALETDRTRVVTELKAGRPAQFSRDWDAEAAEDGSTARKAALSRAMRTVAIATETAEKAERDRVEAIRRVAQAAERQRQIQASRDRQAAEAAAEQARIDKLAGPIPLALSSSGVVFGTRIENGSDFAIPLANLQHMLISGVSGAGKSVLMHSLLFQLLELDEVERLVLIDLKGGVSFYRYRHSPKVEVVYEMPEVMRVIDGLMSLMIERQNVMRENGTEFWRGGRVFVVIDEYAEIQTEIDAADTKEAKAAARRLAANLASISRRARALGIVLVCALQRPTVDAMDAAVRNNLNCRLCMRAATNQLAASMLEDLERLSVRPTELPTGQFYYYDASRGVMRLLKAQIAPGVDLADIS